MKDPLVLRRLDLDQLFRISLTPLSTGIEGEQPTGAKIVLVG